MNQQIAILGSRTLLGQHLISAVDCELNIRKKLWDYSDGLESLDAILTGSAIVFNLHEIQDFSVVPDIDKLEEHNVKFVEHLLSRCSVLGCTRIVHLSTVFLQCSSKWPNVHCRESEEFTPYRNECPFPEYCHSKHMAEQIIRKYSDFQCVIARVGPLYGEGDHRSLICDAILTTNLLGSFPLLGDQGGVLQFTYAANAASALLKCSKSFEAKIDVNDLPFTNHSETVLISDQTPVKDVYRALLEPIAEENGEDDNVEVEKEFLQKKQNEQTQNIRIGRFRVPFYAFYSFYWMLCMLIYLFGRVFRVKSILFKMPCPQYFYIVFRHWTFFSDFKLRLFFDVVPRFDWNTSLRRSRAYYRKLKPEDIDGFSWMPSF